MIFMIVVHGYIMLYIYICDMIRIGLVYYVWLFQAWTRWTSSLPRNGYVYIYTHIYTYIYIPRYVSIFLGDCNLTILTNNSGISPQLAKSWGLDAWIDPTEVMFHHKPKRFSLAGYPTFWGTPLCVGNDGNATIFIIFGYGYH